MKARFSIFLLPLLACEQPAVMLADAPEWCRALGGGPAFQVADSGGVQIVTSLAPEWREPLVHVGNRPLIVLGEASDDADAQFGIVAGATRLVDGRLVVADGQALSISTFDIDGRLLSRRGGRGSAPGEYQFLMGLLRAPGDTIVVVDGGARRVTLLDPSLEVVDTRPLAAVSYTRPGSGGRAQSSSSAVRLHGRFADGSFLGSHSANPARAQPTETFVSRDSLILRRVSGQGALGDSLGLALGAQRFLYFGEDFITGGEVPLGHAESLAVADDRFYYGAGERFEIEERTPEGRTVRLIRLCASTPVITPAEVEGEIERRLSRLGEDARRYEEAALRSVPPPDPAPAHLGLLADGRGRLWIRDLGLPGEPQSWKVVDREGRWLGDVATPDDVTVLEVGPGYVLGQHTDALGVQSVRVYELQLPVR